MRIGNKVVSQWVWCQWGDCSRRQGRGHKIYDGFACSLCWKLRQCSLFSDCTGRVCMCVCVGQAGTKRRGRSTSSSAAAYTSSVASASPTSAAASLYTCIWDIRRRVETKPERTRLWHMRCRSGPERLTDWLTPVKVLRQNQCRSGTRWSELQLASCPSPTKEFKKIFWNKATVEYVVGLVTHVRGLFVDSSRSILATDLNVLTPGGITF